MKIKSNTDAIESESVSENDGSPSVSMFEIRSSSGWRLLDVRELWQFREVAYFLTLRDIKVRYKQTAIGVTWALLQPAAMMVVFTLFFGRMAGVPSEGIPYPLFALAGLMPWQLFSRAISESTQSLVTDQRLITRVYFPRIMVPLSSVLAASVDFLITGGLVGGLMLYFGVGVQAQVVWLPLFVILMVVTALGVGFWLSALNVEYRDVMYTVPFLNQFWLFVTPVIYPASSVPERWRLLYGLNPMTGVVEGFRWSLLDAGQAPGQMMAVSALVSLTLLVTGIVWFRRRERTFVDALGSGGR